VHHSGLVSEIGFSALSRGIEANASRRDLERSIDRVKSYFGQSVPGYKRLVNSLGRRDQQEETDKETDHD